jgi:hypothetical protein
MKAGLNLMSISKEGRRTGSPRAWIANEKELRAGSLSLHALRRIGVPPVLGAHHFQIGAMKVGEID